MCISPVFGNIKNSHGKRRKEGMREGGKERREDGRKEERKEGRREGRKEGRKGEKGRVFANEIENLLRKDLSGLKD